MKFKEQITEGANWISIAFCIVLYATLGIMNFTGGELVLKDFSDYNWLDWAVWAIITFIPAVLAVVVSTTFSREGLKQGKRNINDVILKFQAVLPSSENVKRRSEREFLTQGALRGSARTFTQTLILSFVTGQLFLNFNWDNALRILINISIWIVLGVSAYSKSYDFATTELKEWFIIETGKLQ